MSDDVSAVGGCILLYMLQVLFIGLKLGGIITWSWLWVLSPLWVSWAFSLIAIVVLLLWLGGKWKWPRPF